MKPIWIAANTTPFNHSETHYIDGGFHKEFIITQVGDLKAAWTPLSSWEEIKYLGNYDLRRRINEKQRKREDKHARIS